VEAVEVSGSFTGEHPSGPTTIGRVASWIALGLAPLVCAGVFLGLSYANETLAYDFRNAYLPAAEDVLAGESPYVGLDHPRLAAETAYVYPPTYAYALVPLTPLSENASSVLVTLIGIGLLVGALAVVGVRDWRCYGAAFLWAPTLVAVKMGSSSLVLAFGCALAWHFRQRAWQSAGAMGLSIAVKLYVWPLLVWALATRRVGVATRALVIASATVVGTWAALGFADVTHYPSLLMRHAELEAADSYSFIGVAAELGLGDWVGQVVGIAVGAALLAACALYGRDGDDARSFTCAIGAALAMTPILWQHYLVLLIVPLAIGRPRFSALWLLPALLFWLVALPVWPVEPRPFIGVVAGGVVLASLLLRPGGGGGGGSDVRTSLNRAPVAEGVR
jgi:alpha-1,2-mannosyltransferase